MRTSAWLAMAALCLTLSAAPLAAVELPDVAEPIEVPELDVADPPGSRTVRTAQAGERLVGVFAVTPGECREEDVPTGSHFRMVQPGGDPDNGPFVRNGDSPCPDGTATPLTGGSDTGLLTTDWQPHPDPAFDSFGNGLNDRIFRPESFFGTRFAVATQSPDPQTGEETSTVEIVHDGEGRLSGQVSAFGVAWNRQHFNQGAPKPDGSAPGLTTDGISGAYDPATGAFTAGWVSTIAGGPFNNFSGVWHLEGTFRPAGDQTTPGPMPAAEAAAFPSQPAGSAGRAAAGQTLPDSGPALPALLPILLLVTAAATRAALRG